MRRPALLALIAAAYLVPISAGRAAEHWVATWASSQQIPEPRNALDPADMRDATIRQVVRISVGGDRFRVRVSNAFGTAPLRIGAVRLARSQAPGSATIVPGTDRPVRFGGQADIVVPAGADYWSDPVELRLPALSSIAVSLYLPVPPERQTGHPGARTTSHLLHGDHTAALDLPGAKTVDHWYNLSGIEVASIPRAQAVAVLGDSITDGRGSTTNGDNRWPDLLAERLQATPSLRAVSVLNHGIGGNNLLTDGLGPNAVSRFDRDVLAQAGVTTVIVFEGVNDLSGLAASAAGQPAEKALVQAMTGAYAQMIARAHAHGLRILGGTILPFGRSGYAHPDGLNEAARQAVNDWIRAPSHFDAVIDFDAAVRDPAEPTRLQAAYDSGDHLHPSVAGYRAMARAIPLHLLIRQ